MTGNDVVDLLQARKESNWQRQGFLEKLFTQKEQAVISGCHNPEEMVWILWSMKEAAYKIYSRIIRQRAFIPLKLEATITDYDDISGEVKCGGIGFYTKTKIENDSIHTIAVTEKGRVDRVQEIKNVDIVKDNYGFPYIYDAHIKALKPVSVSHHGRCKKIVVILENQ